MIPRNRQLRVLACLAGSMTVGSVMLAWLEPTPPRAIAAVSEETCLALAKTAISQAETRRQDWSRVALVPLASSQGATLSATAVPEDVHFLVRNTGEITAGAAWPTQATPAARGEIRVGLYGATADGRIGRAQMTGLRVLLDELNRAMDSGEPFEVSLAQTN